MTSTGTGAARTVQTNAAGQWRLTPLNPGNYSIQVKADGFKSQVRKDIELQVSAVLEVDFNLALGSVTDTVEFTGAAPLLQTEEASAGNVVSAKELERLPVNGRNFTRLILLMPGTSSVTRSQSRGTGQSGTALFSVNGARPQDNNYTIDGFDANMQMMNSPGISPPMEALQEFKIATNTGSQFGRSMGANVSMVIKSGTNQLQPAAPAPTIAMVCTGDMTKILAKRTLSISASVIRTPTYSNRPCSRTSSVIANTMPRTTAAPGPISSTPPPPSSWVLAPTSPITPASRRRAL